MPAENVTRRALLAGIGVLGAEIVLAACAPTATTAVTPSRTPHSTPTPTPTPTPTATPAPAEPAVNMSIWAHCDDDLIFFGNHLQGLLDAGHQVHSVFLTAGDAGKGDEYALGREAGIMAAYNVMRGRSGPWTTYQETLASGLTITVREPTDQRGISLRFFRIPDGNLDGTGFRTTGFVSLPQLASGRVQSLPMLTSDQHATWGQLRASLIELIGRYSPDMLTTSVPSWSKQLSDGDHPDHMTVGAMVYEAWQAQPTPPPTTQFAIGYPVADRPPNLPQSQVDRKLEAFAAYAGHDKVVGACTNEDACLRVRGFGSWIQREYVLTLDEVKAV